MATAVAASDSTTMEAETDSVGFIHATRQNYISKHAQLHTSKFIQIQGQSILQHDVELRTSNGDTEENSQLRIGRYVYLHKNTVVSVPSSLTHPIVPLPVSIGSYVSVGANCSIRAAAIGAQVCIGDHVSLGERVIIKDNCSIANGVKIPADTVVPPFTHVSMNAASSIVMIDLPPGITVELNEMAIAKYQQFISTL